MTCFRFCPKCFYIFLVLQIFISSFLWANANSTTAAELQLIKAVNGNDIQQIKQLIASGVSPNLSVPSVGNLLHLAAYNGNPEVGLELLSAGTDINYQICSGETPLHLAISNNPDFAVFLIKKHANLALTDRNGIAPIHLAAKRNDIKTLKAILDSGFDPNFTNANLESAIFFAKLDAAKLLVKVGAKFDISSKKGIKPVYCTPEDTSIFLIEKGADPFFKNPENRTILHSAIERNWSKNGISFLIQKGININAQDNSGRTALHLALTLNNCYEFLIANGADGSIKDNYGESPNSIIRKRQWEEIKEAFKQYLYNRFF